MTEPRVISFVIFKPQQFQTASKELLTAAIAYPNQRPPDIYYIILDEYGRPDVLNEYLSLDVRPFVNSLKARGFHFPENTHANYPMTLLSISSSLNLQYHNNQPSLSPSMHKKATEQTIQMLKQNRLVVFLRQQGYKIITFSTADSFTDLAGADIFIAPKNYINKFEADYLASSLFLFNMKPVYAHRSRALISEPFRRLPELLKTETNVPKFVYIHIPAGHAPFVYGPNGEEVEPWGFDSGPKQAENGVRGYRQAYSEQILYVNKLVENLVDQIMASSQQAPIIVIQGDHGSQLYADLNAMESTCYKERMSILNAYYLPGIAADQVSADVTPVNTFRLILKHYFGAPLDHLENKAYFATINAPYSFIDVTNRLSDCNLPVLLGKP